MIQQLPGWWDQIGPSVQDFISKIGPVLRPDETAQNKYEKLVQQDPSIVQRLSNMNQEERRQFAKGLGARNLDIFGAMPEGAQLKQQNRISSAWDSITGNSQAQAEANAGITGTQTQAARDRAQVVQGQEDKKFALNMSNLSTDGDLKKLQLQREQELKDQIEKTKKQFPNMDVFRLVKVMGGDLPAQPGDQEQLVAVMNTPGLGSAVKDMVSMYASNNALSKGMYASDHAHNQSMQMEKLKIYTNMASDGHRSVAEAEQGLKNLFTENQFAMGNPNRLPPELKPVHARLMNERAKGMKQVNTAREVLNREYKIDIPSDEDPSAAPAPAPTGLGAAGIPGFGGGLPFGNTPASPIIPANETPEQRVARIRKQMQTGG